MLIKIKKFNFTDYIKKHFISFVAFILLLIFDLVVFLNVYSYYNSPIISYKDIRVNGYSISLVRNGFIFAKGKHYYCDSDALIVRDKIVNWRNNEYYIDNDGAVVTNKKKFEIDGKFYDIDNDGILTICK